MDEMKKCPFCGEMIKSEAIKCRYCHEMLTDRPASHEEEKHVDTPDAKEANPGAAVPPPASSAKPETDANPKPRNAAGTAMPPAYGQPIILQRDPNEGKGAATATVIVLGIAICIQAIFSVIPLIGPVLGVLFYGPFYLTAFILSIVCMCKSRVLTGIFGILTILIMPWVLMTVMPLLAFGSPGFSGSSSSRSRSPGIYETQSSSSSTRKRTPEEIKKQELEDKAQSGNSDAQYELALMYENSPYMEYSPELMKQTYEKAAEWYRKAANQGHADAQYRLGYLYAKGKKGIFLRNSSREEAAEWYRKAADQGHAEAQYELGYCYMFGGGVNEDLNEAANWYRKAADQGHAKAQSELGILYSLGRGVKRNDEEAAKWYRKAAEQGQAEAQYRLGNCYYLGNGIEKNDEEAVKWYRKSAEQGYARAQYQLGYCYELGKGVNEDLNEAARWYRKAADQNESLAEEHLKKIEPLLRQQRLSEELSRRRNISSAGQSTSSQTASVAKDEWETAAENGDAEAQYKLGKRFADRQSFSEAVKWYSKAADQGHILAQYALGTCYKNGKGVAANTARAETWFKKAVTGIRQDAEKGDAEAQWRLGTFYDNGNGGLQKNYPEALKWYRKAADQGNAHAQYCMGHMYLKGRNSLPKTNTTNSNGQSRTMSETEYIRQYRASRERETVEQDRKTSGFVDVDYDEALKWLRLSAEQDDTNGQNALGVCYENGYGVKKDIGEAVKWYRKAAAQNDKTAQDNLKRLGY